LLLLLLLLLAVAAVEIIVILTYVELIAELFIIINKFWKLL